MKKKTILLVFAFLLAGAAASFASEDASVGTWKLNEAKSKIAPGMGKNVTVVYTLEGDQYKAVLDGVDGSGKPTHSEWTGKFDGKDYAVTGDDRADMRSIKRIDARHYEIANKKGGKTIGTATLEYAADGKSRTLVSHGTDASGKKATSTFVYDKQ